MFALPAALPSTQRSVMPHACPAARLGAPRPAATACPTVARFLSLQVGEEPLSLPPSAPASEVECSSCESGSDSDSSLSSSAEAQSIRAARCGARFTITTSSEEDEALDPADQLSSGPASAKRARSGPSGKTPPFAAGVPCCSGACDAGPSLPSSVADDDPGVPHDLRFKASELRRDCAELPGGLAGNRFRLLRDGARWKVQCLICPNHRPTFATPPQMTDPSLLDRKSVV